MIVIFLVSSLLTSFLFYCAKENNTPKWLDILCGITLIITSAIFTYVLQELFPIAIASASSNESKENIKTIVNLSVFIIPFSSAAVGSNLISHALTAERDYSIEHPINKQIRRYYLVFNLSLKIFMKIVLWASIVLLYLFLPVIIGQFLTGT